LFVYRFHEEADRTDTQTKFFLISFSIVWSNQRSVDFYPGLRSRW